MLVIKSPIITEKSMKEYETANKVTFVVDINANRRQAKEMLESVYGVSVEKVWVTNRLGKLKKRLSRKIDKFADKKIMTFQLKKGDKIDIFKS